MLCPRRVRAACRVVQECTQACMDKEREKKEDSENGKCPHAVKPGDYFDLLNLPQLQFTQEFSDLCSNCLCCVH